MQEGERPEADPKPSTNQPANLLAKRPVAADDFTEPKEPFAEQVLSRPWERDMMLVAPSRVMSHEGKALEQYPDRVAKSNARHEINEAR